MNFQEKTFQDMLKAGISYGNNRADILAKYPAVKNCFDALSTVDANLDNWVLKQLQDNSGNQTDVKNIDILALVKQTYKFSRKMALFAKQTNVTALINDLDLSETDLKRLADKDIIVKCKQIAGLGGQYLTQMAAYGVSGDEITAIENAIAAVETMPGYIAILGSEEKAVTQSIKDCTNEARTLLDQTDDAIEGYVSEDDFVNGWWDIRKIRGRHHGKAVPVPAPSTTADAKTEGKK